MLVYTTSVDGVANTRSDSIATLLRETIIHERLSQTVLCFVTFNVTTLIMERKPVIYHMARYKTSDGYPGGMLCRKSSFRYAHKGHAAQTFDTSKVTCKLCLKKMEHGFVLPTIRATT